jgi:hypothetical protein
MKNKLQLVDSQKLYNDINMAVLKLRQPNNWRARAKKGCKWNIVDMRQLMLENRQQKQPVRQVIMKYFDIKTVNSHIEHECTYSRILEIFYVYIFNKHNLKDVLMHTSISACRWSQLWLNRYLDNRRKMYVHEYIELVNTLHSIIYADKSKYMKDRTKIKELFLDYILVENRLIHE